MRPMMHLLNLLTTQQTEQFHLTLSYIQRLFSLRQEVPRPVVPERLQHSLVFPMPLHPVLPRPTPKHPTPKCRPDEDNQPT